METCIGTGVLGSWWDTVWSPGRSGFYGHARAISSKWLNPGATTPPFKEYCGVTQGYPLSPTIFNWAVDEVIRHWVMLIAATDMGEEVLSALVQDLVAYFYAYDGIVALNQMERL